MLTVKEVQAILKIGRNSTYRLIKDNKIKHICVGKKIIIPKQYLIEFLQTNTWKTGVRYGKISIAGYLTHRKERKSER